MDVLLVILIVLIIILLFKSYKRNECFTSKPSSDDVKRYTSEMISHRDMFGKSFYEARKKMDWLDPVIYEDARRLKISNNFDASNLQKVFDS